jgi:hypothetical protein
MTSVIFQAEEVEREKKLILEGKIPVEKASKELLQQPVFKISQLTKKIVQDSNSKVSRVARRAALRPAAPVTHRQVLLVLQTKPAAAGASRRHVGADGGGTAGAAEDAPVLGMAAARGGSKFDPQLADKWRADDVEATHGLRRTEEKLDAVKYESPLVRKLRELQVRGESRDAQCSQPSYARFFCFSPVSRYSQ